MKVSAALWFLIVVLAAASAFANDLTVDRRTIRLDEPVTIIVSLEDAFAEVDNVNVPVKNLQIDGPPSVSSQFSWINGTVVRRKVFRFSAHALTAGPALVGPVVLNGGGGQRDTLAPLSLQVVPDTATGSNDPLTTLRELVATGREPFFVITEVDRQRAVVGEQIVVTWVLYNAANVQRWQIVRVPKLEDFWSEEIDVRHESSSRVMVGDTLMEKAPIRRVALFPLRSGTLTIGALESEAAILRRLGDSPFSLFEGTMVEMRVPSSAVTVSVAPLPPAAAGDIIGDVALTCGTPGQKAGGPVSLTVSLKGRANLRSADPPKFDGPVNGEVVVEPLPVSVARGKDGVVMSRSWRFVVFPSQSGPMRFPPMFVTTFNPSTSQRGELRCAQSILAVDQASPPASDAPPARNRSRVSLQDALPWIAAGALLLIATLVALTRVRRALRYRAETRRIVGSRDPEEVRASLVSFLQKRSIEPSSLMTEASERGDAYRALHSLLDALHRDRVLSDARGDELERRVRDLVQAV